MCTTESNNGSQFKDSHNGIHGGASFRTTKTKVFRKFILYCVLLLPLFLMYSRVFEPIAVPNLPDGEKKKKNATKSPQSHPLDKSKKEDSIAQSNKIQVEIDPTPEASGELVIVDANSTDSNSTNSTESDDYLCLNNPTFRFRDFEDRDCKWVASRPDERCRGRVKLKKHVTTFWCPRACMECPDETSCSDKLNFGWNWSPEFDCKWIKRPINKPYCDKMWLNESVSSFWCPEACQAVDSCQYEVAKRWNKKWNTTIVYLKDIDDHQQLEYAGLRGIAGSRGQCKCGLEGFSAEEFATVNWTNVGSVIINVTVASQYHSLLDSIPSSVTKIMQWREAFFEAPPQHVQDKFYIVMGTHFTDAMLNPFHYPENFERILPIVENPFSNRSRTAILLSSHCNTNETRFRDKFVAELEKHLDLEIYGKCGKKVYDIAPPKQARDFEESVVSGRKIKFSGKLYRQQLKEFYSNFKFFLAVENTGTKGYVSEKIFNALGSGAIPVYLGASRINEFPKLDGKNKWFINARDFPSVKALADYLNEVASDESKFLEYQQWHSYAQTNNSEFMPNAPANMKECMDILNTYRRKENRHRLVCKLCDADYLEEVRQRERETVEYINYPPSWEI